MKCYYMNYDVIKAAVCVLLLLVIVGCSQTDGERASFAESWSGKCPMALVDDEITLSDVRYSKGEFLLSVTLGDKSPVSVLSLQELNEEYSRRVQAVEDYHLNGMEIGGAPFVKGIISMSPVLAQIIDSIACMTATPESTQGWVPLVIFICDDTDTIDYVYNEEWERLEEYEWLNAIMPVEMCGWTETEAGALPSLNEMVKITGMPRVDSDGLLRVYCSYDASPAYTRSGKPMCISEVREKYFNRKILENYLAAIKKGNESIRRFMEAFKRHGIGIKFVVEGQKGDIDYDLADPEFIKRWESWGGSDSIIVSCPI